MNSHFLLRLSSMQFGLDGRVDEPLVPDPRRRRWGRRVVDGPGIDGPGIDADGRPDAAAADDLVVQRCPTELGGRR